MALNDAIYQHGEPVMTDWTPGADVPQGSVEVQSTTTGLTCIITHRPIAANQLGAVATGYGVYEVINADNAANFTKVWWNNATKRVTTTSTGNALFGFIVANGSGGANSRCLAMHFPNV